MNKKEKEKAKEKEKSKQDKNKQKMKSTEIKVKSKKTEAKSMPVVVAPIPINTTPNDNLVVGKGSPETIVTSPTNGQLYVNEQTYGTYLHVANHGWVKLNSWEPYVGESAPTKEIPPNPISGDQYCNILTGDFYHFVEGFDWILLTGKPGPAGPPGPSSTSSKVFTATIPPVSIISNPTMNSNVFSGKIKWTKDLQDDCYQLVDDNTNILIKNESINKMRFKIEAQLTVNNELLKVDLDLRPYLDLTLYKDDHKVTNIINLQPIQNYNTLNISAIVEVYGQTQHKYQIRIGTNLSSITEFKIENGSMSIMQL